MCVQESQDFQSAFLLMIYMNWIELLFGVSTTITSASIGPADVDLYFGMLLLVFEGPTHRIYELNVCIGSVCLYSVAHPCTVNAYSALFCLLVCVFLNVFSMYCQWPRVELYLAKYHWGAMSSILYFSTDILWLNQFWRSLFTVDFLLFLKCVALIILKLVLVRKRYELIFFT